jgi:CRP-like cAMP-binding protein
MMRRKLDSETVVQLLGNLNATWSTLFERYAGFIGLSFRERLETVFKDLGTRFGVEDRRGTLIILELSQEDLAEMIGSSRPMVSKVVGDMVEEGLLARSEQHRFILLRQAERQSKVGCVLRDLTIGQGAISLTAPGNPRRPKLAAGAK